MGNVKRPRLSIPLKMMIEWEFAFFHSEFTHSTNSDLWTKQVETDRVFPDKELKLHSVKNLEHLIRREGI